MIEVVPIEVEYVDHMGSDVNVVNAARVSFAKEVVEFGVNDQKLLDYLAKHQHWSPFAHTSITVRCKVPLFLARQLVKHQVGANWNEESRRYIDGPVEFYLPDVTHVKPTSAKQGAGEEHPDNDEVIDLMKMSTEDAYKGYLRLLDYGVAPEEARMVLPLNSMTNFIWTGSVMFFARVIQQRMNKGAQLVAQEFAHELQQVVYGVYPHSFEALGKVNE